MTTYREALEWVRKAAEVNPDGREAALLAKIDSFSREAIDDDALTTNQLATAVREVFVRLIAQDDWESPYVTRGNDALNALLTLVKQQENEISRLRDVARIALEGRLQRD